AERRRARDFLRDDERGDAIEIESAADLRDVDAQQAQLAAAAEQRAGELPVLLLEPRFGRQDLGRDELGGRACDEAMLVRAALGCEDAVLSRRDEQPAASPGLQVDRRRAARLRRAFAHRPL